MLASTPPLLGAARVGQDGGTGGNGGQATLSKVYGESTGGGTVNVYGQAIGGSGGEAYNGGDGGRGASLSLTNAVDGKTSGDLYLAQVGLWGLRRRCSRQRQWRPRR